MTVATLDPEQLAEFEAELAAAGFTPTDDTGRHFVGPLRPSLAPYTDATTMAITVRDGWPYVQPSVFVSGIKWWHAAHEQPCLWQVGDNTKRWITLQGISERIDEWADHAARGFEDIEGAALDPHLYFDDYLPLRVGIDLDTLVGNLAQNGQHGVVHFEEAADTFPVIAPGMGKGDTLWGRWFYRSKVDRPPTSLAEFEEALSEKQRAHIDKLLEHYSAGLFILIWPTPHGMSALALRITQRPGQSRVATALRLTPTSQRDRLRRAGPDATALATKRVMLFGIGAIGSHLGGLLVRSGLGNLTVIDFDVMTPGVLVRHAATGSGDFKVNAFEELVRTFEWTNVEPITKTTYHPFELAEMIMSRNPDLCIDATGDPLFAELLSRIAAQEDLPVVSTALYRGGRVARVRRQHGRDHPIAHRIGHWRYPQIPAGHEPQQDFVGTETGCMAPIHNAPPTSVVYAASLAATIVIDLLTARLNYPDEIIDVLEPIERPLHRLGRYEPKPPPVMLTDDARSSMITAANASHPRETGGILVGVFDDAGAPYVTHALEFEPDQPCPHAYVVPAGVTTEAVANVRTHDERLGYLGEWHSHPSDQPASPTDERTMNTLSKHPDTGFPVLCVLRPKGDAQFDIDSYVTIDGTIAPTATTAVGPLAEVDNS
jgi:proteasome lid subunit RPN8/RPN11